MAAHQSPTDEGSCLSGSITRALKHLADTQNELGSWYGDYGGPMFLLPTYIITMRIIGEPIDKSTAYQMIRYLEHHQNDGGSWGLYYGSAGTVYTTTLSYIALRLLGCTLKRKTIQNAQSWILKHGGATQSASWGKFVLALLGAYDYEGLMPVLPELWILPTALPLHPSRMWCHARMVYLPMSYLYSTRAAIDASREIRTIREEIYTTPYAEVDWKAAVDSVSEHDEFTPIHTLYKALTSLLSLYEYLRAEGLRQRALTFVLDQIRQEDQNTSYICLGPINKLFNLLTWHFVNPGGPEVRRHLKKLPDYLWNSEHGINMNSYNSSQLWDTCFAVHAISASGQQQDYQKTLACASAFIIDNQITEESPDMKKYFRKSSKGGWPFSVKEHDWPISDCTAEAMKASLLCAPWVENPITTTGLVDGVEYLLGLQNPDGGWPTYEPARAPAWLEMMNPSNIFANIIIDYSYPECTSACIQALVELQDKLRGLQAREARGAIQRGKGYLLETQKDDGSWYGSWGICFTYGTWFGIWGLLAAGVTPQHRAIRRAVTFLIEKQQPDGGWGETMESCRTERYHHTASGQVVMTSWALLGLIRAGYSTSRSVERGIDFLLQRQLSDGTWPEETIAGVFNKTCAVHYDNYRKVFPLWALGYYRGTEEQLAGCRKSPRNRFQNSE